MRVAGVLRPPGDKSISHRALIIASIADGESHIRGILEAADVRSTARVLRSLGAAVPELGPSMVLRGDGRGGLRPPAGDLDCGNSGTTARLTAGLVAGSGLTARFIGDRSLSGRPMRRIADPLRAMGATIDFAGRETLPFVVRGGALGPIDWESEQASAQVKSCVLLAAVTAGVDATVREPTPTRDHTERMLRAAGVDVSNDGAVAVLRAAERLAPLDLDVPGDPSSAAFLVAAAVLAGGGRLEVEEVCLNPLRTGFLDILRRMGAMVEAETTSEQGGEPVGRIRVAPAELSAVEVGREDIAASIDELPLLACVAVRAGGTTTVSGAGELRVKESDRIAVVVSNLRALGVEAEESPEGFSVKGQRGSLRGRVVTHGDHRIAMAFGVLASDPRNAIEIDDRGCVAISYPRFWNDLSAMTSG